MKHYLDALEEAGLINSALYQQAVEASLELKEVIESTPQSIWPIIGQILSKLHKLPFSKQISYEEIELKRLASLYNIRDKSLIAIDRVGDKLHLVSYDPKAVQACQELGFIHQLETQFTLICYSEFKRIKAELSPNDENLLEQILREGQSSRASDVHIQPRKEQTDIRFRIDGLLHPWRSIPHQLSTTLVSRIKVLADLDITEHRNPQDGRLHWHNQDIRVSILPTIWGEKVVLRMQAKQQVPHLDKLGLMDVQLKHLKQTLLSPHGLFLVTGPTGSGKSLTLYSCLKQLQTPNLSICTVEDPVEIQDANYNQVQIDPNINYGFAEALRSLLRQDPDIIMLGEIRDSESAQIAIRAAQTGHLVLSTLHTNSARESIPRLLSLGVSELDVRTTLKLVIAQRLIRRACLSCTSGCPHCNDGYKGRIGLFELYSLSEQEMVGGLTLHDAGKHWQALGVTTKSELDRVIGHEA